MSRDAAMAIATGTPAPISDVVAGAINATTETPVVDAPSELDSTRFNRIAKQEAELQKQREEFKRERELVSSEKEKLKPIHEKLSKFEELMKTDRVAALKLLEFTDTDLMNFAAAQEDTTTPEEKARLAAQSEIKKFQDEQAAKEAKILSDKNDRVIESFKKDITKALELDKDKYEYCNFFGDDAQDLIYETVSKVLEESQEMISIQEAADMVEKYYEDEDSRMSTIKKRTPAQAIVEAKAVVEQLKAEVSPRPDALSKTLTNKSSATVASTITRKETSSEKRERLIRKLGGN